MLSFIVLLLSSATISALQYTTKDEILQRNCLYAKGLHPNLIRFVTKEGYHRDVEDVLEVTFTNSPLSPSDFKQEGGDCKLALVTKFTEDLFVDPYEIKNTPFLYNNARILNNWADLEGPAWSSSSNSTIFINLISIPTGNLITTEQYKLPIHFRYQKPLSHSRFKESLQQSRLHNPGGLVNPAGYTKVIVPLPRLLLRCDSWASINLGEAKCHVIKTLCTSKSVILKKPSRNSGEASDICEWISLPFKSNSKQGNAVFIPVGDTDQVQLVSFITIFVVFGGMMFLLHTLVRASEKLENDDKKEQ